MPADGIVFLIPTATALWQTLVYCASFRYRFVLPASVDKSTCSGGGATDDELKELESELRDIRKQNQPYFPPKTP